MENEAAVIIATTVVESPTTVTTAIVPAATAPAPATATAVTTTKSNGKMKKRGGLHILRVALFMLRRKTNKQSKSVHVDVASKGLWKRLVGSMRPLHLQDNPNSQSPPPALPTPTAMIDMGGLMNDVVPIPKNDSFHDVLASPMSPHVNHSDSASSSAASLISLDNSLSRYASAQNLQELDKSSSDDHQGVTFEIVIGDEDEDEDDDEEEGDQGGGDCGDEMIDARAEEFIAQFYEQMRIQQEDLINRYNEKKKKKMAAME